MNKQIKIAPSILSADFAKLGQEVSSLDKIADYIHIDVMDGHFVPNITIGPDIIKSIRNYSSLPFDVHLMINNVDQHIPSFVSAGADIITIHAEATTHLCRSLSLIKSMGIKAGVSIVPSTNENILNYIMDMVDVVLVMTVNPGFGGQAFIKSQLDKISNIRRLIDKSQKNIELEVDGGINEKTAKAVIEAGADVLVSGSYIFSEGASHYLSKINTLRSCK